MDNLLNMPSNNLISRSCDFVSCMGRAAPCARRRSACWLRPCARGALHHARSVSRVFNVKKVGVRELVRLKTESIGNIRVEKHF